MPDSAGPGGRRYVGWQFQMISLKKSLDQIEHFERLFHCALQAYLDALSSLERHSFAPPEDDLRDLRHRLIKLRKSLASEPTAENLRETAQSLDGELREYKDRLEIAEHKKRQEVQQILGVLAEAASALERHHHSYDDSFRSFTRQLEIASRLDDLSEIRRRLTIQVAQMKASVDRLSQEHEESFNQLKRELESFQQRLERAELLASTDNLTGLANRREGERRLREFIQSGSPFSVLFLDLDQFKSFNDRYGHNAGDQVLIMFAQRLRDQFRQTDVVCRWGGDEFMVIVACRLEQAKQKAREVAERVAGWYTITSAGRSVRVLVRASIGVAEHQPGETAEQLFARADALLYADKGVRTAL